MKNFNIALACMLLTNIFFIWLGPPTAPLLVNLGWVEYAAFVYVISAAQALMVCVAWKLKEGENGRA